MKILYITSHLRGTDGWSRYSVDLIGAVKELGHDTKEIFLEDPFRYILNPLVCHRSAKLLSSIINNWKPDMVHFLVEPYANTLPFIHLNLDRKPKFLLTIHGTYSYPPKIFSNPLKRIIARKLYLSSLKKITRIISVSNFTKEYFSNNIKCTVPPISVVSNGIRLVPTRTLPKSMPPKILFVGGIKERKGIKEAILALKAYKVKFKKDFSYVIVGSFDSNDIYYIELKELIKKLDLESNIRFTGRVSDDELENHYATASLFLMLPKSGTKFEGFGLVYLEAARHGLPAISSLAGGAKEAISQGQSGFSIDSTETEEVTDTINKVLNEGIIKRENCLKWAEENKIENKAKEIIRLYNAI